ncbi:MAG: hypothetical protein ACTSQY_09920 [Candidatus Odinarchaeia archaeon]
MAHRKSFKLGIFAFIGCILFTVGIGFTLYHNPLATNSNSLYFLSLENNYTANITLSLNAGEQVLLHISPFSNINYTLTILNSEGVVLIKNSTELTTGILNIIINSSDVYLFSLSELPPFEYTQLLFEIFITLNYPAYSFITVGVPLILGGILLTVLGYKEINFLRKKIDIYYHFEKKELLLIVGAMTTYALTLVLIHGFLSDILLSNWLMVTLFVALTIVNIIIVYETSIIFKENKLRIFTIFLLLLAYTWPIISFILVSETGRMIFNFYISGYLTDFSLIRSFMANYRSLYFQTLVFILIIPTFYVSISYTQGANALNAIEELEEKIKSRNLTEDFTIFKNILTTPLRKGDLTAFFLELSENNIEASALLYLFIKEYVVKKTNTFTYNKMLIEHKDLFNKKLYDRKPVETLLLPLGYVNVSEGRFKFFSLNLESEEIRRIISLFSKIEDSDSISELESAAGLSKLKDRKLRYSGLG